MSGKIKVLMVDDHALLRSGMKLLIQTQHDLDCVGEAEDGQTAVRLVATLQPDVITLDLGLRTGSGLEWVKKLVAVCPAKILILTMFDDPSFVRAAMAMGASGYLHKSAADVQLLNAIRTLYKGGTYIDATMDVGHPTDIPSNTRPKQLESLSARELEVLVLVAQGNTNQVTAERLCVSVKTVESYRSRLMEKLLLRNRADLTRFAMESGLLKLSDTQNPPTGHL